MTSHSGTCTGCDVGEAVPGCPVHDPPEQGTCIECSQTKPIAEYLVRTRRGRTYRHGHCRACQAQRERASREKNMARYKEANRVRSGAYQAALARLRERHPDEFDALYAAERADRAEQETPSS